MRIAFLPDIHGNLPALEAVLQDLKTQTPDRVYFVGDQVNRCPWSREVMDLVLDSGWPAIRGNHEVVLARFNQAPAEKMSELMQRYPALAWTWQQLRPEHRRALEEWPDELPLHLPGRPWIRIVHGIPGNPFIGIYPEATDEEIERDLAPVDEPVVVCGHTHRPLVRQSGRWFICNGGSIGLPYNGDPRAQYLLLDAIREEPGWQATLRQVDYDRSGMRQAFEQSGMMAAAGKMAELFLRTVLTGEPWASDFGHWLRNRSDRSWDTYDQAIEQYLEKHGPGRWSFFSVQP